MLAPSIIVPIVAGIFLAAIGSIIIILQIGIHIDRKERDAMRGFDDHQDNYGNPGLNDDIEDIHGEIHHTDAVSAYPDKLIANSDYQPPMIPVSLEMDEIDLVRDALNREFVYSVVIAYDPIDKAIKFKVNGGTWSPPMGSAQIDTL